MSREPLDELLDASAPVAPTITTRDVRVMMTGARSEVRRAERPKRVAVIAGAVALVMAGGAGVATAADYWASLNNPIGEYTYQVPSGATCEVVFGDVQIIERSDRERQEQIQNDLLAWFDRADLVAIAESEVDEYMETRRAGLEQAGTPQGDLAGYDLDMAYAYAIDRSVSDQAMAELERLGYADEITSYGAQGRCPGLTP